MPIADSAMTERRPARPVDRGSYTFVNCLIEPWNSPWLSRQALMSVMSERHRVFLALRESTVDQVMEGLRERKMPAAGLSRVSERIWEMRPSSLYPKIYASRILNEFSLRMRAREIRRSLDRLGWDNRILYLWNPVFSDLIGRVGARLTVFHCHDYYPGFFPEGSAERHRMEKMFNDTIQAADLVFACSDAILNLIRAQRTRGVALVENGVDFDRLRTGADAPIPEELRNLPRPIVGYIGRVNRKVDLDVMMNIARRRPEWTVLLMGPKTGWSDEHEQRFKQFLSLPNARYLEGKPPDQLPAYMNALDVGLMNYVKEGTWMSYGFPLKMFEYFALGKPAVATDLISIRKYAPHLRIVRQNADWVSIIDEALASDSPTSRARRIDLARRNSWRDRAQFVLGRISTALREEARR